MLTTILHTKIKVEEPRKKRLTAQYNYAIELPKFNRLMAIRALVLHTKVNFLITIINILVINYNKQCLL